ncbi:iron chaperone [Phycicoccus avicenniae]|uniref:iron chaperone n=1 Tax=Phycicoccus avicenniae TaxID=2828860 RepID=UPI003D28B93F
MADTVDGYLAGFDGEVRSRLETMRELVLATAPDAVESMAYGMPAYKLDKKPLVYFAGFDKHVGFYATPNGHEAFAEEFARYKQGKGSVQLPHTEPLPIDLVRRVVEFRVAAVRGS